MSTGLGTVVAICAAIGTVTVVATLATGHAAFEAHRPINATAEYGRRLLAQTQQYLGPDASDPRMRFTASQRACASCHIDSGAEPGELSLIAAVSRKSERMEDRINECITRSLNGRPLPVSGTEMIAMVSWLQFLAAKAAATAPSLRADRDPPAFQTPNRAARPEAGEQLFAQKCADCHGRDGAGLLASRNLAQGYLFPPLWGPDSFTDRSEMRGIPIAARFIKAKMPLGRPDLSDDQAFDIAAFINAQPRPR